MIADLTLRWVVTLLFVLSAVKSYNYGNSATFTCTGGTCR